MTCSQRVSVFKDSRGRLAARLAMAAAGCLLATGCALRYTDAAGRLHTVGLVWHTTAPLAPPPSPAGEPPRFTFSLGPQHDSAALLRQRTFGATLSWTDFNRGLALGYAEQLVVLPALAEGMTTVDFDSRQPLATVLTFDGSLRETTPRSSP